MVSKIAVLSEKCKNRSRFKIQWQYAGDGGWILSGDRDHFFEWVAFVRVLKDA